MVRKKKSDKNNNINSSLNNEDPKLMAFIATFLSIIGFVIILISGNKDKYVRFYARQSIIVFIFAVSAFIIGEILILVPIFGNIINVVLNALVIAAWVVSWVFSLMGKENQVPIIGKYERGINF